MQARKTHEQQREITSNAGAGFVPMQDLARNKAAKTALEGGSLLRTGSKDLNEDRGMIRGASQKARHQKRSDAGNRGRIA